MAKLKIKKYITEDVIVTFITLFVSVIIEMIKQINLAANVAGKISLSVIDEAFCNLQTWQPIVNVSLITVILWCIIGITKLLNKQNLGRRTLIFTMIVFIFAIVSIVWYVIEAMYPSTLFTIIFGSIISVLFFLILIYFLSDKTGGTENQLNTNHIVAAEPNTKKR